MFSIMDFFPTFAQLAGGKVPDDRPIDGVDIVSAEDWVQTLMAGVGEPDIANKLLQGYSAGGESFKVHLDGYDQRDLLAGKGPDKRRAFFYWTDDGNFAGLRYDQYKAVFMEQPAHGLEVWLQPWSHCARPSCSTCVPTRSMISRPRGG